MAEARAVATPAQIDTEVAATLGLTLAQGTKIYSELFASAPLFIPCHDTTNNGKADKLLTFYKSLRSVKDIVLDL